MTAANSSDQAYTAAQREKASDWFVIIHSEQHPGSETLQAWLQWLEEHEGNRMAFEAIAAAWHTTPPTTSLATPKFDELVSDSYEGEQSVEEWLASRVTARRRPRKTLWFAAASLVAVTLSILAMNQYLGGHGLQSDAFTTKAGEQIEITLDDGSRVWLGPKSSLQVGFTQSRRFVQLETGEAFFAVKKDRKRPFVVGSNSGDISAVGTAFNVRAVADHVTVSVSEGAVTVASKNGLPAAIKNPVLVASGQQLTFAADDALQEIAITQSPMPGERARWRSGVLIYRNERLQDVVSDVARYSDKELQLAGSDIGDLRYSGVVYKGAIDEWLSALPESFPVQIVTDGNRATILSR